MKASHSLISVSVLVFILFISVGIKAGSVGTYHNLPKIGYYAICEGQGAAFQENLINVTGFDAVQISDLSAAELAPLDVLYVENVYCDITAEYVPHIDNIDSAVQAGLSLVIFDWDLESEALMPGPGAGVNFDEEYRYCNDLTFVADTLLSNGPYGTLNNESLDAGNCSYNYVAKSPLPPDSTTILVSELGYPVMFTYPYGHGAVTYGNIPLGHYLMGSSDIWNYTHIFAPNMLVYAVDLVADGPYRTANMQDVYTGPTAFPAFYWYGLSDAAQYRLYVQDSHQHKIIDSVFNAPDVCLNVFCSAGNGNYTNVPPWGLLNGTYAWWVGAQVNGVWEWSGKTEFSVDIAPSAAPANVTVNPGDGRVVVTFDDDPNIQWIRLWIGKNQTGLHDRWYQRNGTKNNFTCNAGTCSIMPDWNPKTAQGLRAGLRPWGLGGFGAWSASTLFDLPDTPPDAPTNIAVVDSFAAVPMVTWQGQPNTTWYQVSIYDQALQRVYNKWFLSTDASCAGAMVSPADYDCFVSVSGAALQPNVEYSIWMRSWGPAGFSINGSFGSWNSGSFMYMPM